MPHTRRIAELAEEIVRACAAKDVRIATAESCTGGLIGGALTDVPGSSVAVERGFIVYSNDAKAELLGVPRALLRRKGAVCAEVAAAMAEGALARSRADIAVAVTGIAGPDGGGDDKPLGLVWFAVATHGGVRTERRVFAGGSRSFVRAKTVETALAMISAALGRAVSRG